MQQVVWIPGRVASAVVRDPELSQHLLDHVLKPGLLPADIPLAEAAKLWGTLYHSSSPQVRILAWSQTHEQP